MALDRKGFCVAEDEGEFWFFGGSTVNALRTFQACEGLPESGVVDEASWLALCGEDAEGGACDIGIGDGEAGPDDGHRIDRGKKGVFLIGEGRYEDPEKLIKP